MAQNAIRVGIVDGIDDHAGTVRVTFPDQDDKVIDNIALMAFEERYPSIGDSVVCFFTLEDGAGFCLGTYFNDDNLPSRNKNFFVKKVSDLMIEYDYQSKQLNISPINGTTINSNVVINGNLTVTGRVISS